MTPDISSRSINAVFGDRYFLSDGSVSQLTGNDGTRLAEWLKEYTPGDIVIGSCLMNKTDGVLNGNIYNLSLIHIEMCIRDRVKLQVQAGGKRGRHIQE